MPALTPSRTKYRKSMKGRMRGNAKGGDTMAFGDFAIQSL
jgi:large subunit ribosomal protein L16